MVMTSIAVKINDIDNVGVMLKPAEAGCEALGVTLLESVDKGHKFALCDIRQGQDIIKYGCPIGRASCDIKKGSHVHTHNLKTNLGDILEYEYKPQLSEIQADQKAVFYGFKRTDGKVGIRNEIWIINTVGCVNKVSEKIAERANAAFAGRTDGVFTFVHPFGCSQMGDDQSNTQKILACMVNHPNAAGVLVLGLGCENNNIGEFKKVLGEYDENRVKFLNAQDCADEVEAGLEIIGELVKYAEGFKREEVDASNLVIGLKCGGSDGLSGITANPLVGRLSDMLISHGGTAVLTEVPEMFGAETLLMNRCQTKELFDEMVKLINDFKEYYIRYNQEIYENPSPGNKKGGISSLEDKSLGCVQKGGTANIVSVLDYGDVSDTKGLNILQGPGNDIVAITALMAAGAHLVLFTTGRGTPVGAPVPTVKISTNTELAENKPSWTDFNAGVLTDGRADIGMDGLTRDLFNFVLDTASGKIRTKNEINGYREISIFKDGVTL